ATGWHARSLEQKLVAFVAVTIGAVLLALSLIRQMVPGSKHLLSPTLLPIGVLVLHFLLTTVLFQPPAESGFVSTGLACFTIGIAYSASAALLLWLMVRRGAWLAPKLAGATVGTLAGLMGLSVLEIHCPNLNLYHIMTWHLGAVAVTALVALVFAAIVSHYRWASRSRAVSERGLSVRLLAAPNPAPTTHSRNTEARRSAEVTEATTDDYWTG
ncbi:MAG: NrsF family protein, partial [Candidatus Acidiferrales bacterium]